MKGTKQHVDFIQIDATNWDVIAADLSAIEEASFPPSIRDSNEELRRIAQSRSGLVVGALSDDRKPILIGYVAADRLEAFPEIPGIRSDPHYGLNDTCYVESWAVARDWRGGGIGRMLLEECLRQARLKGYRRATAHMNQVHGLETNGRSRVLQSFPNWYHTGLTFVYLEYRVPTFVRTAIGVNRRGFRRGRERARSFLGLEGLPSLGYDQEPWL